MFDWVTIEAVWIGIGFLGQGLFASRFIIQWFVSERERKSVVPIAFWYFSLGGGTVLLSYAIYQGDPVFITGQATGLIVYSRNLYLIYRERAEKRLSDAEAADAVGATPPEMPKG